MARETQCGQGVSSERADGMSKAENQLEAVEMPSDSMNEAGEQSGY